MLKSVKFLLTVVLAMLLLAGCGGQDTLVGQAEEEAGLEEVVEEETPPPYQVTPEDVEEAADDEAKARERLEVGSCQADEMLEDLGRERAQRVGEQIVDELSAGEFENIQEAYAARGYTCGGRYEEAFNP